MSLNINDDFNPYMSNIKKNEKNISYVPIRLLSFSYISSAVCNIVARLEKSIRKVSISMLGYMPNFVNECVQ